MHEQSASRPTVSFAVPCYNEQNNIAGAIAEIETAARDAQLPSFEIIVVDDCSTDSSRELVAGLAADRQHVRLVANKKNLGFGGAYKAGVRNARGVYVIMIPGDNSHPSEGIVPILKRAGEADMVIPFPSNPEARGLPRRIVSWAFTTLVNLLFGLKVAYFNGCVLHRTDLINQVRIRTNGFAYQAEAVVKLLRAGATYVDIPVAISERSNGKSSAFKLKNIYRVCRAILSVWLEVHGLRHRDERRVVSGLTRVNRSESALNR
jgi:dolichol-phosphate mannosyltransferase